MYSQLTVVTVACKIAQVMEYLRQWFPHNLVLFQVMMLIADILAGVSLYCFSVVLFSVKHIYMLNL